ncbi:hypothetical protein ACV2FQ_07415 [Salmonella enterica subsp. enterica serovar Poona]|nr:hypothetical protein [Salmonella enterica subsp. enterica serovar Muenchen]
MKEDEKGFSLFELSVFLIVLSAIIASFIQAQRVEILYGNNFVIAQTIKKYTIALNRYLSDNSDVLADGVQDISLGTLIKSGVLGKDTTNTLGRNKVYFHARKVTSNNITSVSGLVTVKSSTISDGAVSLIEGMLGRFGGRKDEVNMELKGNWGGWVLDLNEWPGANEDTIFSYIPNADHFVSSTDSQFPIIDKLNLQVCESGSCFENVMNDDYNITWSPLFTDDFFRIIPSGSSNITFYKVTINYSGSSYVVNTNSEIDLNPGLFNKATDGDITVSIVPASSTLLGPEKKLIIHKVIPFYVLPRLWSLVDIRIDSDDPYKSSGVEKIDCTKYNLLPSVNGKLYSVVFQPKTDFSKTIYDIELSLFGNIILFKKNSFLALSYAYDSNHYPWFFINHPKNSGYIDSCILNWGEGRAFPVPVGGVQLKIGNKVSDVSNSFRMTQWVQGSKPMRIYYPVKPF